MTKKSRYFLAGSAAVLLVGLGAGTLAYLTYYRNAGVPAGLPAELKYVPADAQMVAYADVRSVMASEMRRELERMTTGRRGQQQCRPEHETAPGLVGGGPSTRLDRRSRRKPDRQHAGALRQEVERVGVRRRAAR